MKHTPTDIDYERIRWLARHATCWACRFCGTTAHPGHVECHHIAGRIGENSDRPANWASLCREHHAAIQSADGAEVLMLVLKREFDGEHYDARAICLLRGRQPTWITDLDVVLAEPVIRVALAMGGAVKRR